MCMHLTANVATAQGVATCTNGGFYCYDSSSSFGCWGHTGHQVLGRRTAPTSLLLLALTAALLLALTAALLLALTAALALALTLTLTRAPTRCSARCT